MKIYNVFNSEGNLLASFDSVDELSKYIRRHNRDKNDTTILSAELNSWNESDRIEDVTIEMMHSIWAGPSNAKDTRGCTLSVEDEVIWVDSNKSPIFALIRDIIRNKEGSYNVRIEFVRYGGFDSKIVLSSELYKLPLSDFRSFSS